VAPSSAEVQDYFALLKPRVMSLVVFTGLAGVLVAPGALHPLLAIVAVICIAIGAGAAGAINMWYDRDIDGLMTRTRDRPLPAGRLRPSKALWLGCVLAVVSVGAMGVWVNLMAAALLFLTIAIYVFVYTIWLKRRTPQNIVIGGASGALPPMIGWAAVTGDVGAGAVVLFLIIFMWTPPHFWALALFRSGDYAKAGVPMLPVVAGMESTRRQILAYAVLLVPITVMPAFTGLAGPLSGALLGLLGLWFVYHAVRVLRDATVESARAMFRFSLLHLFLIFLILLAEHGYRALA
jgi:protoheme IX farnesyltransferase